MPLVEIKLIEGELSEVQARKLIGGVTDVVVSFVGENMRPVTWVVLHEVKSGNWGVGGNAVGIDDVRKIQLGKQEG